MPTTDELIALGGSPQIAIVVLDDGIELGFTDNSDLVGIDTGAGHSVILGLQRQGLATALAINLRDGQWLDSPASVTVDDFSAAGILADLFLPKSTIEQSLGDVPIGEGLPIHPNTDLTGRPDLDEMNVGLERIGANGARHQFAVPPGFDVGLDHTITTPALDIDGAPVSDSPIVWIGRRVAIYLCFRDHVTYPDREAGPSSWRPFSEAKRLWCGTVKGPGTVKGRRWTFAHEGPDSLLRKPLAASFSSTPVRIAADVTLVTTGDARTDGMLVRLATGAQEFGVREWVTTISATTTDGIRDDVIAEIAATAAATGTDGVWDDQAGFSVAMDNTGAIRISVADGTVGPARMAVALHRSVWSALGYDMEMQAALYPDETDPRAVEFVPLDPALYDTPGPDYWLGDFPVGLPGWSLGDDNGGAAKVYRPYYLGGTTVLRAGLNDGAGQVVRLDSAAFGGDGASVAHPGQLAWPVASDQDIPSAPIQVDGVDCDRCGLWLFTGKRRYRDSEEVFDERWVGLASWANGGAQEDALVQSNTIIVIRWLDPKLFGYTTKGGSDSDWVARDDSAAEDGLIQATPLAWLGYQLEPDRADIVLQRLLWTTGTSLGWDDYENNDPHLDEGENEPTGTQTLVRDCEIADLGLAIPDEWIASTASFQAEFDKIENQSVTAVKVAFTGGYQAEDVIRSLMQSTGWAWHFRDGRFGIWCPADTLTLADATVVLTPTVRVEKHASAGTVRLVQDMQKWLPVDKWRVAANWQPFERKTSSNTERRAPDSQFRYRPGEAALSIQAHASRNDGAGLAERLLHMSRWFAQPHFEVRQYPVEPINPGLDVWPGTICRITDAELIDPSTGYGVENRLAIVTATARTFGTDDLRMTCDLLVLATRTTTPRINAPIAQGTGYNSATGRLYVSDDWAGIGNGWADADAFVEPAYTGIAAIGGNAVIECWQWDGSTWAQTFAGTVTSRVSTVGAAYLVLASTSGTYYRDMDTWVILRPSTVAQAAWVEALFSPIASNVGQWTDDAAATQDVYPWEQ